MAIPNLFIIAAVSQNNVIGKDNKLPWYCKEDLKKFKETTINHSVIMGRKTFESIGKKPLAKRENIIISKTFDIQDAILIFKSIKDFIANGIDAKKEYYIIGGESIYKQFEQYCSKIFLTSIPEIILNGDTFFPIDLQKNWCLVYKENLGNNIIFNEYIREEHIK